MPVKFFTSPRRALAYIPFGSRRSHSASGVSTKNFNELILADHVSHIITSRAIRTHRGRKTTSPAVDARSQLLQNRCGGCSDHGRPLLKPRAARKMSAHDIAVQNSDLSSDLQQPHGEKLGGSRFAGTAQTSEPDADSLFCNEAGKSRPESRQLRDA